MVRHTHSKVPGLWQQHLQPLYRLVPALLPLGLMLFFASPLPLPYFKTVAPLVILITVYYWSMYGERYFPYWLAFVYGLIQDSLMGSPIGASSLLYLVVWLMLSRMGGRFGGGQFALLWMVFAGVCAVAAVAYWLAALAMHARLVSPVPFLVQGVLTLCIYPCFHWLYGHVYFVLGAPQVMHRHAK